MPPSDPVFVNVPADVWTPVVADAVSVVVNILEAFADVVYYQTYRLTGAAAPDNTANPGDVDFEGVVIFNRRDRIAGKDVFVGGVEFKTTEGIDVYIYPLGKAGKVRVDSLAAGNGGGGAEWGGITGTLSDQTDLQTDLDGKKNTFSENTAFNKNFGLGVEQVAEGNALAAKITGPGSSQINEILVAVDENGNAKVVPIKIDPITRKITFMGETEQDGDTYIKDGRSIYFTATGKSDSGKSVTIRAGGNILRISLGTVPLEAIKATTTYVQISRNADSTGLGTGGFRTLGGASIAGNLHLGGNFEVAGDLRFKSYSVAGNPPSNAQITAAIGKTPFVAGVNFTAFLYGAERYLVVSDGIGGWYITTLIAAT